MSKQQNAEGLELHQDRNPFFRIVSPVSVLVIISAVVGALAWDATRQPRNLIEVPAQLSLGDISSGKSASAKLEAENPTDRPVDVRVRWDCTCMTVTPAELTIPPKAKATFNVQLRARSQIPVAEQELVRNVVFECTNGDAVSRSSSALLAVQKMPVVVAGGNDIIKMDTGPQPTASVHLNVADGYEIETANLRSQDLTCSLPVPATEHGVRVELEGSSWLAPKTFPTDLVLRLRSSLTAIGESESSVVELPITVSVRPPVKVRPSRLLLLPYRSPVEVVIEANPGFKVTNVKCPALPGGWTLQQKTAGRYQIIADNAAASRAPPPQGIGSLKSKEWTLEVYVQHQQSKRQCYEIPVNLLVHGY